MQDLSVKQKDLPLAAPMTLSPLGRRAALQKLQPVPADGDLQEGLGGPFDRDIKSPRSPQWGWEQRPMDGPC